MRPVIEVKTTADRFGGVRRLSAAAGHEPRRVTDSDIEKEVDEYLELRIAAGDILGASKSSASLNSGSTTAYTVTFSYIPAGEVLSITVSFSINLALS